jgi:ABC-type multidrug transport system permease subunit
MMRFSPPLVELTMLRLRMFWRESGAVFWTFGFPLALTVVLGVAFRDRPPDPVAVAVEAGPSAQPVLDKLRERPDLRASMVAPEDTREELRTGRVSLVVKVDSPRTYVYDPSRPESRLARALVENALDRAASAPAAEQRITEPGSRYVDFLVPGLIGSNIMQSGMWGIGYVLVDMRGKRLIKRMVATPMRKIDFLLSFVLMRILFLAAELLVLLLFGALAFGVPVRGSIPLICALSLVGSLSFSGLGLLVAARASNLATINGLINLVTLPMFLGSGVFFSTARFPDAVQPVLKALPLTALNDALRAVMLDGRGWMAVLPQFGLMALVAVAAFAVALRLFRWR